jgi:hypothetical protein
MSHHIWLGLSLLNPLPHGVLRQLDLSPSVKEFLLLCPLNLPLTGRDYSLGFWDSHVGGEGDQSQADGDCSRLSPPLAEQGSRPSLGEAGRQGPRPPRKAGWSRDRKIRQEGSCVAGSSLCCAALPGPPTWASQNTTSLRASIFLISKIKRTNSPRLTFWVCVLFLD